MRKIFLFELNHDITNLIKNAIQNEFDDEVKTVANLEEALKEVSLGDYDIVIARDKTKESSENVTKFLGVLNNANLATGLISIGQTEVASEQIIGKLDEKFNMSDLIQMLKEFFQMAEKDKGNLYAPVSLEVVKLFDKCEFKLFSKLKRPGKEDQYVQRISPGDEITNNEVFEDKVIKKLYLEKVDRLNFNNSLITHLSRKINIDFNDFESVLKLGEQIYRTARQLISKYGPNEISYRLIKCLSEEMVGNLKKSNSRLSEFIFASIEHTTSYSFKHLNLIGIFGYICLPHIDIMEEKRDIYLNNFIYAAHFHDIILEKDGMAQIHTKNDWIRCEFSEEEKNLIKDHAKLASELMAKFPGLNKDSIQIVKEHHGVPSGVGFVDRKNGNLFEAAVLFDVIHDFVEVFLNFPPDGSLDKIFYDLMESYHIPLYKEYSGILKDGIVETFKEKSE